MKRILMICFTVLLLCQVTVFAQKMPDEEMCIGGMTLGCTIEYVKNIYGEPSERKWTEDWRYAKINHYYVTYDYTPSFSVTGLPMGKSDEEEYAAKVAYITLKDNSLSTPSGITVGLPYQSVVSMFGEGQKRVHQGKTWYEYRAGFGSSEMQIHVDDKGIITKIFMCISV